MLAETYLRSGKVRDLYALPDDRILLVASDRLSAFDVVLPTEIPDKGRVLTGLSRFWFAETVEVVPNHLISTATDDAALRGRVMVCRRTTVVPIEAVVRGYLAGSGWKAYRETGEICGVALPPGLRESDRLPEPIFTPATKAEQGEHDENIDLGTMGRLVGQDVAARVRDVALALYAHAAEVTAAVGILLADTKFEFGFDPTTGELLLIDEALTPDSSRLWDAADLRARPGPGELRQAVRARLARDPRLGQDGARSIHARRDRRRHARPLHRRVRADHRRKLRSLSPGGCHRPMTSYRFAVNVLPKPGILDPQGRAVEGSLGHLGIDGVSAVRVGRRIELTVEATDDATAMAVVERLASELLANPLIETYAVEEVGATSSTVVTMAN